MTASWRRAVALPPLRWRDLALIALALVVIVVLRKQMPTTEEKVAPIPVHGSARLERVAARNFAAQVLKFRAVRVLQYQGGTFNDQPVRLSSPGIWLVLVAKVEALQDPGYLSAQLRTRDGLVYRAAGDKRPKSVPFNLSGRQLAVGLAEEGGYFFELPPEQLQGAHLQFYWGTLLPRRVDSLIDIDLGVDKARAQQLVTAAKPMLELPP